MDSNQLIQALHDPSAYPHPIRSIELVETHISWVLLTGIYAYKIKKPVNFGFLDFSTLEKRRYFCEEELRLNQRLAADIYLDVVTIGLQDNKLRINATGPAIEYAVRMLQFDRQQALDVLANKGRFEMLFASQIGQQLALFHQQLANDPIPTSVDEPQPGTAQAVWLPIAENFSQIASLPVQQQDSAAIDTLHHWSQQQFNKLKALINERRRTGFVRECHGDLHLGNMVCMPAKDAPSSTQRTIVFFDCIEFDPRYRQIDVACELSFTVMDLEARDMHAAANLMLNTYLEYSGDFAGLALLAFYKVYFAIVRAKVNLLRLNDEKTNKPSTSNYYQQFHHYITLARTYTKQRKLFIAITHGVSGTGKSTVAQAIAAASGAIRLRSDIERKRLYGLDPLASSDKSIYTQQASQRTFKRLHDLLDTVIGAGMACIVDATFLHAKIRQQFFQQAKKLNVPFYIVDCQAPEPELIKRLLTRQQRGDDASEATVSVMHQQQQEQQPLTAAEQQHTITLDTTVPLAMSDILKRLLG